MHEFVQSKTLKIFCEKVLQLAIKDGSCLLCKEQVMNRVQKILHDESRTMRIDYTELLKRFASEIGSFLIEADDHDVELRPAFFGENGEQFFIELVYYHILFNAECSIEGTWRLKKK